MKIKYLIILLIFVIPNLVLAAPSASISTNASSIEKGKSVTATVTLTDTAAWNIKIVGSGAASCSQKQADVTSDGKSTTKKFTLSCTSTTEGTITFKVTGDITSGSGQTKDISLTKDVAVTKPKSSDNSLKDLKVDGVTVSGFSSSKTSYTLKDNSGTSISIAATANDSKASISGTGAKKLEYGKNSFNVVVTAENGAKKTYTIIVNKPDSRSANNNLKSLTVDKGTITFDKNTTSYTLKLEHNISEITINATVEDSKAKVTGIGKKSLNDYANEFKIIVTAENGSTKTYTLKVLRKDKDGNYGKLSDDNSVKSITIVGYDFEFNADTKKYNLLVEEDTKSLEINVIPNDSTATVLIQNNDNLKSGLNEVVVKVISESGDANEYKFNIYKLGVVECEKCDEVSKEKNGFNIWLIFSIIELIVLIIFSIRLSKKNNNLPTANNAHQNPNNTNVSF